MKRSEFLFTFVLVTEIKLACDILEVVKNTLLNIRFHSKINNIKVFFFLPEISFYENITYKML